MLKYTCWEKWKKTILYWQVAAAWFKKKLFLPTLYLHIPWSCSWRLMCRWRSLNVCVSFFVNWLFQTQLSTSRHDGHLVFHVETHQMTDAQKQLIAGPCLLTGKHRQTELNRVDTWTPCVCKPGPTALPVPVHQPAAGGALCLLPCHWVYIDQRPSCSLWPGNLHYSWGGTLPALDLIWKEAF